MASPSHQVGIFRLSQICYMPFHMVDQKLKLIPSSPELDLKKAQNFVTNFTASNGFAPSCCDTTPRNLPRPLMILSKKPSGEYYPVLVESNKDPQLLESMSIDGISIHLGSFNRMIAVLQLLDLASAKNYISCPELTIPLSPNSFN